MRKVNFQRMKLSMYEYTRTRERLHRQLWNHKQPWNAKKQLLHVLRVMEVSNQLIEHGHIVDYNTANHFYHEAKQDLTLDTHDKFKQWWNARHQPLYYMVKQKLNIYKDYFASLPSIGLNQMAILDYLQLCAHNDFEQLDREICVTATNISYPSTEASSLGLESPVEQDMKTSSSSFAPQSLILLERTFNSPRHPAIQQCYRVVIRRVSEDPALPNWRVVALAPRKFWQHGADKYVTDPSEKFGETLDLNTTLVYKKPVGIGVLMFWHENELCAVFCASGMYAASYAIRHGVSPQQLGTILYVPFWTAFRALGCQDPPRDSKSYQFCFHPDENHLRLLSIMDVDTLVDISMGSSVAEEGPFFEKVAKSLNWPCLERVQVVIPYKKLKNEYHMKNNLEAVHEAAQLQDILRYEGFLLCDALGVRVQSSLPQFAALEKLMSMYERKHRTIHFLAIVRATINDGQDRFCRDYPQWASWYRYTAHVLRGMCVELDTLYKERFAHIEGVEEFQKATEGPDVRAKALWKLRAGQVSALTLFTTYKDLDERSAVSLILQKWVSDRKVFADVAITEDSF